MIPGFKKLTAMYVYEILSEAGEPKTREQINNALSENYNIEITLKTLKALLTEMMDAGLIDAGGLIKRKSQLTYKDGSCKIKNTNMYTNYFVVNEFADDELLWIIHNTIFSKQLTENKSNNLVERLLKLGTKELRSKVGSVKGMKQFYHTPNPSVSINIETLSDAIHEDKTVQFIYTEYKKDKQLHPISEELITVKPARMVPLNGFYYLIAYETESETIQHYRIDKIKNLKKTDIKTDFSSKNSRINIDEYLSSHSFMFVGKPIPVKIKVPEDKIGLVIDRFGDKIHIYQDDSDYVSIGFNSNESDLYVWALENGDYVEVIEPQRLRNRIRETVQSMTRCYLQSEEDVYFDAIQDAKRTDTFCCDNFNFANREEWFQLTDIISLDLHNNGFTDISILNRFKKLEFLNIQNEHILDISVIKELPLLGNLCLRNTDVESIECLCNSNIRFVELLNNKNITDYSPLYYIKNLRLLTIDDNAAEKIDTKRLLENNDPLEIVIEYPHKEDKHLFSKSYSEEDHCFYK